MKDQVVLDLVLEMASRGMAVKLVITKTIISSHVELVIEPGGQLQDDDAIDGSGPVPAISTPKAGEHIKAPDIAQKHIEFQ